MRRSLLVRLASDTRGVSAVEFAFVAPVMVVLYLGLADICQGYMAQKRMGHVAAIVADLVAQEDVVTEQQIGDFFSVGALIMKPFRASPLLQRVSSVTRNANGSTKVDWSRGMAGLTKRNPGDVVPIPAGLIDNTGESIIMVETAYDYDSPIDYVMPAITQFRQTYYLRPREAAQTLCTNC